MKKAKAKAKAKEKKKNKTKKRRQKNTGKIIRIINLKFINRLLLLLPPLIAIK